MGSGFENRINLVVPVRVKKKKEEEDK